MIALLLSPLGKLAGAIALIAALAACFAIWLARHDAAVLEGYVRRSEVAAAESAAKEAQRQRDAAAKALEEYRKRAAADQTSDAAREVKIKQEIADYEAELVAAKRDCRLGAGDIDHILRHR